MLLLQISGSKFQSLWS